MSYAGAVGVRSQTARGAEPACVTVLARWGVVDGPEGFFPVWTGPKIRRRVNGLNLAMIGSGVDGGFLAFLPVAYVFCCKWNWVLPCPPCCWLAIVGLGGLPLSRELGDLNYE